MGDTGEVEARITGAVIVAGTDRHSRPPDPGRTSPTGVEAAEGRKRTYKQPPYLTSKPFPGGRPYDWTWQKPGRSWGIGLAPYLGRNGDQAEMC